MSKKTKQDIAAKAFVERWTGIGQEDEHGRSYWLDMLQTVFGIENATQYIEFEKKVKSATGSTTRIDAFIPSERILIEQKSIDKDLRKAEPQSDGSSLTPFEQAMRYRANLSFDEQPRWIIVCNFKEIMIHNMQTPNADPVCILLENFENDYHLLSFLVDNTKKELQHEMEVSIKAGELVGRLYDSFLSQFGDDLSESDLHSLNVLCVRLVFCLYAEDAGIFEKDQFVKYMQSFQPENMRIALRDLFTVLDTPIDKRDRFLEDKLKAFPYVNGALFKQQSFEIIPPFNDYIASTLLLHAGLQFDWKDISPTIFGAVFESTLNQDTRRKGGMHYTSIENIHKVIDPLFMDDLYAEFEKIKSMPLGKSRTQALMAFQDKLASLTFFDPACGSGNFLTETYLSLRRLENEVIKCLTGGQAMMGLEEYNPIKVSIHQFYGIEINDFAASVATTALWIAEYQMLEETESIVNFNDNFLPLKSYSNIKVGNALRIDWKDVIDPKNLTFIIGNPPFVGQAMRTKDQAEDMQNVFAPSSVGGKLDYVAGWYKKAADLMDSNEDIEAAFVSSNSICQGESVNLLWELLYQKGIYINFAHTSFKWISESNKTAAVFCVIVSFSKKDKLNKVIFEDDHKKIATHINGYLKNAPDVFIKNRSKSVNGSLAQVVQGSPPADDGRLLLTIEERDLLLSKYPELDKVIKPFVGSREFINETSFIRYCLWFDGVSPSEFSHIKELEDRFSYIRQYRLDSPVDRIQKTADTPFLFTQNRQPKTDYLIIPRVSSSKRIYIPIGFLSSDIIASDSAVLVYNAGLYDFGIISSIVHNAWMRTVAGRLKADYRYAPSVFYNFPFPSPSETQKSMIEKSAKAILDARNLYKGKSLADMYGEKMYYYPELLKAHQANDKAVMAAYGFKATMSESDIVAELFKLYEKMTKK